MFKKAVFPGMYIQGAGAIVEMPSLIRLLGKHGLVLASPTVIEKVLPRCSLELNDTIDVLTFRGECCEEELDRLSKAIHEKQADVLIGMGGGKTIDTAKIAADRAGIPVIIIPTIASSDAPCSGCAVVYSKGGVFERVLYQRTNPSAVLVDLSIIAEAPTRFLVAGMGDALATWFEARSCRRTHSKNECGGYSTEVGLAIAKLCYETLLADGVEAKDASDHHIVTPAFDHIVEANILLSGIGFESGGLASAHAIHNGLTALPETHDFYHGEKVAFGLLAGLHLIRSPSEEIEMVYSFCEQVGLPTTLEDIGLKGVTRDELSIAAEKACAPEQSIHHEGVIIDPSLVLDAMLKADAMGKARNKNNRDR
ncbi:MAG: glycerol dehydrogenase [Candidatus Saccharibacteria bacterium]